MTFSLVFTKKFLCESEIKIIKDAFKDDDYHLSIIHMALETENGKQRLFELYKKYFIK